MPIEKDERSALYVQIPRSEAEKLDRAAFELKAHKRDLVAALVASYVDPTTPAGLERLRALEVPPPLKPERRRSTPRAPAVQISRASEWVAGMQRAIRDFAQSRRCPKPLVRVTLDDGERLYLQALAAGPDDDFVTLSVYEPGDEMNRVVVLRLDAIRKVELLKKPPSAAEKAFVFEPRPTAVGFAI